MPEEDQSSPENPRRVYLIREGRYVTIGGPAEYGFSPTPLDLRDRLCAELVYTHVGQHPRPVPIDPETGRKIYEKRELRALYGYDRHYGRLFAPVGYLPRFRERCAELGYEALEVYLDEPERPDDLYEPDWDNVLRYFRFRPGQRDCLLAIASNEGGVIDASVGFGKGHLLAMVAAMYPKANFVGVVPSKTLARNARKLMAEELGMPDVGQVGGGRTEEGRRITVCVQNSLHRLIRAGRADYDVCLVDEMHRSVSGEVYENLLRFPHARMFGASGSTDTRADGDHARAEGLFGPTIFEMSFTEAVRLGLVVPLDVRWVRLTESDVPPLADAAGNPLRSDDFPSNAARDRMAVWLNGPRNRAIAAEARHYVNAGYQVLVLCEKIEHLYALSTLLPDFAVTYGGGGFTDEYLVELANHGVAPPDASVPSAAEKQEVYDQFRSGAIRGAIATSVWNTGVSFEGLNVVIQAVPTGSETISVQLPGRACRVSEGKTRALVVDFRDEWYASFTRKAGVRSSRYGKTGFNNLRPEPPRDPDALGIPQAPRFDMEGFLVDDPRRSRS